MNDFFGSWLYLEFRVFFSLLNRIHPWAHKHGSPENGPLETKGVFYRPTSPQFLGSTCMFSTSKSYPFWFGSLLKADNFLLIFGFRWTRRSFETVTMVFKLRASLKGQVLPGSLAVRPLKLTYHPSQVRKPDRQPETIQELQGRAELLNFHGGCN